MQTFVSQYGRDTISVPDKCPTISIRCRLGSVHVREPDAYVRRLVVDQVRTVRETIPAERDAWDLSMIRAAVRFALWQHRENRALTEHFRF